MNTDTFIRKAVSLSKHGRHALAATLNGGHYSRLNVHAEFTDVSFMSYNYGFSASSHLSKNWYHEWQMAAPYVSTLGKPVGHVFTIFSYNTPIAWWDERRNEWVIPNVFYSPTTAKHQAYVKRAVSREVGGWNFRAEPIVPANYRLMSTGEVQCGDGVVRDPSTNRII